MSPSGFMPHGHCYLWNPGLVRLHVLSDFLIAAAYFSIPFTLLHFVRRRKDLPFNWIFVCFGIFIIACGLTHVLEIITLWKPWYWLSGTVKAITALASVPTALLLVRLVPRALAIPNPAQVVDANEALREQTKMLSLIVSNIGDGLLVVDHSGRTLLSNPAAKRMFGFGLDEELPDDCATAAGFYLPDQETRLAPEQTPTSRAMRGEAINGDEIFVRQAGQKTGVWAEVTARPLRDERGMIHGAVAVFHDISAEKEARRQEENLRKERAARLEAEEASKAKDRFLAMLGHELRTPLTPVLATVDLLQSEASREVQTALNIIRRNVELEARLIDDILDLTAINKGKIHLQPSVVDVHSILHNAAGTFGRDMQTKNLHPIFELRAEERFVKADPARVLQIFWNLIKNAIKFTPEGGEIKFCSRNENGDLVVEVADNGAGIEPEVLPRIFESFEQGQREVREGHGGLGLGLAIAKGIVNAHEWQINATSAGVNRGTTISLRMPWVPEPAAEAVTQPSIPPVTTKSRERLRILLVDDHKDTVRTLELLLTRLGYQVTCAENMTDALRLAQSEKFDLLLTDIGLPDGSGIELMRQIRARQKIDGIALSGFGMEEDLRKSREAGFLDHLIKPINIDRLQAIIREAQAKLN